MNKIFALLSLAVLMLNCTGVTHAGGCPDGSEPVKSVSADGTYFVYNCGGQSSSSSSSSSVASSNTGTIEVAMKPNSGDWMNESIFPWTLKEKLKLKYRHITGIFYGDFDNDGVDDLFVLGVANQNSATVSGTEENGYFTKNIACDINADIDNKYSCYDERNQIEIYSIKDNVIYKFWNGKKQKIDTLEGIAATNVSGLLVNNNPIEMQTQGANHLKLADFNGDGVLDIFITDSGIGMWDGNEVEVGGKNDLYYLSQKDGSWLESTSTHVTGEGVKNGKGLPNFSHGGSVGDIDGDGDIDVVVSSIKWVGNNSRVMCYVNQGDGHMVVRMCGDQFGYEVELGDIDNDGDLDIVFGGELHGSLKDWNVFDRTPSCSASRCLGAYSGILLNDGKGNFFKRGFEFEEHRNSNGFSYEHVPNVSVADLDGDGDLDVIRMLVGNLYAGVAMTIEENIGNGQFKTVLVDEWCKGPPSKEEWQKTEGGKFNCFAIGFKLGDFNKDGLIDIVVDAADHLKEMHHHRVVDGTVFLSTEKFTYDTIHPDDRNYPLVDIGDCSLGMCNNISSSQQAVEDELAAFEAELAAELNQ